MAGDLSSSVRIQHRLRGEQRSENTLVGNRESFGCSLVGVCWNVELERD